MDSTCEYRRTHARIAPGKEAHRPLHRDGSRSFPIRPALLLPHADVIVGDVQLAQALESRNTILLHVIDALTGAGGLYPLLCIHINMSGAYVRICKLMLPSLALDERRNLLQQHHITRTSLQ